MGIAVTSFKDLLHHLTELGLVGGMDVVVHSKLMSFGQIPGGAPDVYAAIREVVGAAGTIAVPTYRLESPADEIYDPRASPSKSVGVFAEFVRKLPDAVRSACPMHSHAAVGPKAGLLSALDGCISMGPGSDFDVLERAGFVAVYLGCKFSDAATFTFHVEACFNNIPYRQWLDLKRTVVDLHGQLEPRICRYYGRTGGDYIEDLEIAYRHLAADGLVLSVKCPYGVSSLVRLTDFKTSLTTLLMRNPTALLKRES